MLNFYNVYPNKGIGFSVPYNQPASQCAFSGGGVHCVLSLPQGPLPVRLFISYPYILNIQSAMQSMGLLRKAVALWGYIFSPLEVAKGQLSTKINVKLNNNLCNKLLQLL
jgi:hypothetical protein